MIPPIIGIDGCPSGWCAVIYGEQQIDIFRYKSLEDLVNDHPKASHYIIDMPMGLGDSIIVRDLDSKVREILRPRQSTIFNAPCRQILDENNYSEANEIHRKVSGKGLSIQSWNLVPKIRELDSYLIQNPEYRNNFFESSPELCFAGLNNGLPVIESKLSIAGINNRMKLLSSTSYFFMDSVKKFLKNFPRNELKIDDILDAYVLCISGIMGIRYGFKWQFNSHYRKDARGIPMRVIHYEP